MALTEFQKALERRDYAEAQRIRDLRTPIEAGTYEGWFSGDDSKIGLAGKTIQPIFIYPAVGAGNDSDSGNFVDTGKNKYIWTGNWQLSNDQHKELDKNLKRALSESGLGVLPTKVKNSVKPLEAWQRANDQSGMVFPEDSLGVSNHHMSPGVVPYYIVRGMGGYAGATPGNTDFTAPYSVIGDTVIESLAGFEGLTAYARILMDRGTSEDEARYMASKQSQMGTVLHEAMHMVGALPHTADENYLQDYETNYGGQHGEAFMHAISADVRGQRSEDTGKAMALVMGEPWNYGWGTDANPDGAVANPVTSNEEFTATATAKAHPHPHPQVSHTKPGEGIPIRAPSPKDEFKATVSTAPIDSGQDIVQSAVEPEEVTDTMANGVPFRKNAQGTWEIQGADGQWHSSPEWQSVLENVRSVKYDPATQDYQFAYMLPGANGGGGRVGVWGLEDIKQMYTAVTKTPIQPSNQPTNIHEAWYASNQTAMPDIWMRNDIGVPMENQAGDPIIDPEKLERVIDILRQQGAWDMGEPQAFNVPGVQEPFVRIGDRIFKGTPSYAGADGMSSFDIPGTNYMGVMGPTGGITTVQKSGPQYEPGMVSEEGPGSIDLPGYDILQDREGGLTPYAERYTPKFHIDSSTMTPFIQQPDGRLEIAEMPSMDDLVTMYLQQGQSAKAVAMANFRDRPTSLEYFNATMEWARTPADMFTVSAIVRGLFAPEQGEIGDLRRIGAPPSWAKDAWVGLQASMGLSAMDITAAPNDAPGSFVESGGNPEVIPQITTTMGIPNVVATNQTVTPQNASMLFDQTGVLAEDVGDAAAIDAELFDTFDMGGDATDVDSLFDSFEMDGDATGMGGTGLEGTGGDGAIQVGDMGTDQVGDGFTEGETLSVTLYDLDGNPVNVQENLSERLLLSGNFGETPNWNIEETFTGTSTAAPTTGGPGRTFKDVVPYVGSANTSNLALPTSDATKIAIGEESFYDPAEEAIDTLMEGGGYSGPGADISFDDAVRKYGWDTGPQVGVDYSGGSPVFGTVGNLPMNAREERPGSQGALIEEYWDTGGSPFQRTAEADVVYEQFPEDDMYALQYEPTQEEIIEEYWDTGGSPFERQAPSIDYGGGDDLESIGFLQEPTQADIIQEYWEPIGSPVERGAEPPPQTFTVPAEPVDVVGWDTGMTASDLGPGRELVFDEPQIDPDDYAGRWYDEGADGMRTRNRLSLVGESGPELALFPNGTEIIPLDREMKPDQKRRLRRRGAFADAIDSFQFGGMVGGMGPEVSDLPAEAQTMPAGVTEMLTGRPTRRPRSLFRPAGLRTPSAQTISNLLPEEIEVYQEMGRLAGIPEKAFEREFRSMVPMGQGGTSQARFTPRRTGRTRYGRV